MPGLTMPPREAPPQPALLRMMLIGGGGGGDRSVASGSSRVRGQVGGVTGDGLRKVGREGGPRERKGSYS